MGKYQPPQGTAEEKANISRHRIAKELEEMNRLKRIELKLLDITRKKVTRKIKEVIGKDLVDEA